MFTFDRDTATLVAVVVCIAATAYLFRELRKTKDEFATAMAEKQQPPPPAPVYAPLTEPVEVVGAPPPAPKVMTTRKKSVTIAEKESAE